VVDCRLEDIGLELHLASLERGILEATTGTAGQGNSVRVDSSVGEDNFAGADNSIKVDNFLAFIIRNSLVWATNGSLVQGNPA
jgi:hypothetical protein